MEILAGVVSGDSKTDNGGAGTGITQVVASTSKVVVTNHKGEQEPNLTLEIGGEFVFGISQDTATPAPLGKGNIAIVFNEDEIIEVNAKEFIQKLDEVQKYILSIVK